MRQVCGPSCHLLCLCSHICNKHDNITSHKMMIKELGESANYMSQTITAVQSSSWCKKLCNWNLKGEPEYKKYILTVVTYLDVQFKGKNINKSWCNIHHNIQHHFQMYFTFILYGHPNDIYCINLFQKSFWETKNNMDGYRVSYMTYCSRSFCFCFLVSVTDAPAFFIWPACKWSIRNITISPHEILHIPEI